MIVDSYIHRYYKYQTFVPHTLFAITGWPRPRVSSRTGRPD